MSTTAVVNEPKRSPLGIQEILYHISLFVPVKDALSCILVSKYWVSTFIHLVWHTVDFKVHERFTDLEQFEVEKYGHHIRIVEHVQDQSHLASLQRSSIRRLSKFGAITIQNPQFLSDCFEIIRRNSWNLTIIKLSADPNCYGSQDSVPLDYLFPNMICDYPSKLSHIQYRGYMLAGTSLSNTLRRCPALHTVDLEDTSLISALEIDMYRHPGVKHVVIRNIGAANGAEQGRAIVRHFPNLEAVTLHSKNNRMTFPVRAIKEAKGAWNLRLKVLDIESLPESVVNDLSMHVSGESTKIALNYSAVSPIVILSMLVYRNILTDILACVSRGELYMNRDVPAVDDHFRSTGWMMQALPRHCPKLETLEIPDHEMDMDDVESVDWACKDLSELRVRIKGLDTAEKIDDALDLWKKRRLHEKASVPNINAFSTNAGLMSIVMGVDDVEAESTSIEARVARHLLRFDRLTTVWLGTSVWSV